MFIKPADGLTVRDPVTMAAIPPEGVEVDNYDLYWASRLRDGDVLLSENDASPPEVAPPETE